MRDGRWCHWTRTHDGQGGSSAHCATVTLGPARHTGEGCSGDGAGAAGVLVSLYCDVRWLTAPAGPRSWRGRGAAELNSPARARQVSAAGRGAAVSSAAAVGGRVAGAGAGSQSVVWVSGVICLPRTECHYSPDQEPGSPEHHRDTVTLTQYNPDISASDHKWQHRAVP